VGARITQRRRDATLGAHRDDYGELTGPDRPTPLPAPRSGPYPGPTGGPAVVSASDRDHQRRV